MSVKLPKRLSSKKKKPPMDNAQAEVLFKLGLEAFWTTPLDPASMLDMSTWTLENETPLVPKYLPRAFLQRLWLLSPEARSPRCKQPPDALNNAKTRGEEIVYGLGGETQCAVNPLDLVTAVYMSANSFLQQEITVRMVQCQFAVPLVLPPIHPEQPSCFLLWPLRDVVSQWRTQSPAKTRRVLEGDLASTEMPMVSCVKLGHCGVSKSRVLSRVIGGLKSCSESFLHRGMDGGQLPRRLSNGLVELGWYLPTGDPDKDIFPVPVVISNLRGDAAAHEKCLSLLCRASSVMVVFCGNLREKEKCLLASWKGMASKLMLIDLSDDVEEKNEKRVVGFVAQNLEEEVGLPKGSVLSGGGVSEEDLADRLRETLNDLLPDKLKLVTLEAAARTAVELGLSVDEGAVCKKAMATAEEVLKGLVEGSAQFREKQLPLQGALWSELAEMEKKESKQRKAGQEINLLLQKEKKNILFKLSSYRMTTAMKVFTEALSTTDKMERTYFLSWMKLRLRAMQMRQQHNPQEPSTNQQEKLDKLSDKLGKLVTNVDEPKNGSNDDLEDNDSFCTVSTVEEPLSMDLTVNSGLQLSEQQFEIGQEALEHIVQQSAEQNMEPQSPQKEQLESMIIQLDMKPANREQREHDPVLEQQMDLKSTEKENMGLEVAENQDSFEEQISDPEISEDQNLHSESRGNGTLAPSCPGKQPEEPKLKPDESDSNASVKTYMGLDASSENQIALGSFVEQHFEPDSSSLGLEHFLREMGLIFELTHISPGSGSHNVLRLPSLAADLLLYGIPLELMDGDASNIPSSWLGCVLAEFKRRLPRERVRTRVLTNLGVHHARNAEVLSALFGVKFPRGRRRSTRGVYMLALCLPDDLRKDMECDFLLLIDVEGLCSPPLDKTSNTLVNDNEMATVATGLSDVLMQNIASYGDTEFETDLIVIVNALLRTKVCGYMPICQLLTQDERLISKLQALQLGRVAEILQTETGNRGTKNIDYHLAKAASNVPCVIAPWHNVSLSEPVDKEYSTAVLKLKQNLFGALKKCAARSEASGLPEFMARLCDVWEAVKAESFSIGLQNTEVALAFSMLCTELSQWENNFLEHMECWFMGATKRIISIKVQDTVIKGDLLSVLKDEAREEVETEVNKVRSKLEAHLIKDNLHKTYIETYKPNLMDNMDELQKQVTEEIIERLESAKENHYSSTRLRNFQTLLEKEQESKLHTLLESSKSTKILFKDIQLEEEFEGVWSNALSNFDFRPSETDDITARVTEILRENLNSRGLEKHMKKLEDIGQARTSDFKVYDEHFGYRSRLKHMFDDNNRQQRLEAHRVACNIIEEYNQFAADKSSLPADFSDSYITELLENVEKALSAQPMEIRSAFEVDLKVYLCSFACQDFQKLHDRYAKDRELLTFINGTKNRHLAEFIYHFRKRDQCQRVAQAFTSMVFKSTALDYIYRPLGRHIMEDMVSQGNAQQYMSPRAFNQSLLEELMEEDSFESFLEYLLSYDRFRLKKIQERVVAHLSESAILDEWRQQRLGEIVGKMAAAVSQTAEGVSGVLSDTKLLLEKVCLSLEKDGDVDVTKASLDGPLFSITTEWDRFVTCLLEALAEMRLSLAQEFSQNVDITQLLQALPIKPQDCLLNRVRGCEKQCPFCRAPCEVGVMEHEVHRTLLHRPKGMLSYTCDDSCSLSHISCPANMTQDSLFLNKGTEGKSLAYRDYHSLYPDWSISPEEPGSQTPSTYWRYVLVRFNGSFAQKYEREAAQLPEEWEKITREEALDSLKDAFHTGQC
ncbi:interferon-induced very large GTPase 1 [Centroberyx gerrardi]